MVRGTNMCLYFVTHLNRCLCKNTFVNVTTDMHYYPPVIPGKDLQFHNRGGRGGGGAGDKGGRGWRKTWEVERGRRHAFCPQPQTITLSLGSNEALQQHWTHATFPLFTCSVKGRHSICRRFG